MAVKIRLMRMGKKKQPTYRVVVADGRSPRDGRFIEVIGRYDPRQEPSIVEIDNDKALTWLKKGAQPTDPARKLLEISGVWSLFKVARGEIHTIAAKPAPKTAPTAEEPIEPEPEPTREKVEAAVVGETAADVIGEPTEVAAVETDEEPPA
jgi:small subunit ribosomal protein S16